MRALVLLLLVAVSFFLVVEFYPSTSVEGREATAASPPAEPVTEEQAGPAVPLERPATASAPVEHLAPARADEQDPVAEAADDGLPGWLADVGPPGGRSTGEVPVAAALLRGGVADVLAELRRHGDFPTNRAGMAEAFALALDGDPRGGLEVASRLDESALSARERQLLQIALGGDAPRRGGARAIEAGRAESPLVLAMEMRLWSREGARLLEAHEYPAAARVLSDLLLAELDAPWDASHVLLGGWSESLEVAQRHNRWDPKGEWPGVELTVEPGDTPIHLRKRYLADHPGEVMCSGLILQANAVEGYIQPGQVLRVPTDPVRVLVDLDARWALFLMGDEVAGSWPVGIGREGEETPRGEYVARNKLTNPSWMRAGREPVPFGDPDNPLGTRWIGWYEEGEKTSYGFHGTWEPQSVGKPSSDGCIRLRNEDVERLFEILPEGAPILVR